MNIEGFAEYLRANNCEILAPTNEWEALRYRHEAFGVVVVYVNKAGRWKLKAGRQSMTTRTPMASFWRPR